MDSFETRETDVPTSEAAGGAPITTTPKSKGSFVKKGSTTPAATSDAAMTKEEAYIFKQTAEEMYTAIEYDVTKDPNKTLRLRRFIEEAARQNSRFFDAPLEEGESTISRSNMFEALTRADYGEIVDEAISTFGVFPPIMPRHTLINSWVEEVMLCWADGEWAMEEQDEEALLEKKETQKICLIALLDTCKELLSEMHERTVSAKMDIGDEIRLTELFCNIMYGIRLITSPWRLFYRHPYGWTTLGEMQKDLSDVDQLFEGVDDIVRRFASQIRGIDLGLPYMKMEELIPLKTDDTWPDPRALQHVMKPRPFPPEINTVIDELKAVIDELKKSTESIHNNTTPTTTRG